MLTQLHKFFKNPQYVLASCFATKKSHYQILGLKSNATQQDIKKAYRILAQKYHPDKNPDKVARDLFLEAKQAYEILVDQDKRRQYDNQSFESSSSRRYSYESDPFSQFASSVYKDRSRVHHQTYSAGTSRRKKGQPINKQIKISFLDAAKGIKIPLSFSRKDTCTACNGNRCQPGTAPTRCLACGGSGSTIHRQSSIAMHFQCNRCSGTGLIIKNPCQECKATGIKVRDVSQQLDIPAGVSDGQKIIFQGKGNQSQSGPNGDLFIKINVDRSPKFRKIQNNIESTEWVNISQAALGSKKVIQTLWGKKQINVAPGIQDGTKIKLKGEGIKKKDQPQGDHICMLRIKVPTNLTPRQRQIFQQLAKQQGDIPDPQPVHEQKQKQRQKSSQGSGAFDMFKNMFK